MDDLPDEETDEYLSDAPVKSAGGPLDPKPFLKRGSGLKR